MVLVLFLLVFSVNSVICTNLNTFISQYFSTGTAKQFSKNWQMFKYAYESAISKTIMEEFEETERNLNTFLTDPDASFAVAAGFHFEDNATQVLLGNLTLKHATYTWTPEIQLNLAANVLRLGAGLTEVHISAGYIQNLRGSVPPAPDPLKYSPFSYPPLDNHGNLTIVGRGCNIVGNAVIFIEGTGITLGQDNLGIEDCTFTIEIFHGEWAPTVVAPYFTKEQGEELMILLAAPIRHLLLPKLQGALTSYVNNTAVFKKKLAKYSVLQQHLLVQTRAYLESVVTTMNANKNVGQSTTRMPNFYMDMNTSFTGIPLGIQVRIEDVTLYGLDSAYISHTGGPYKSPTKAGEISDAAVSAVIDVKSQAKSGKKFGFRGWRKLEFSTLNPDVIPDYYAICNAVIAAYLHKELPEVLTTYLSKSLITKNVKAEEDILNENYFQTDYWKKNKGIKDKQGTGTSDVKDAEDSSNSKPDGGKSDENKSDDKSDEDKSDKGSSNNKTDGGKSDDKPSEVSSDDKSDRKNTDGEAAAKGDANSDGKITDSKTDKDGTGFLKLQEDNE